MYQPGNYLLFWSVVIVLTDVYYIIFRRKSIKDWHIHKRIAFYTSLVVAPPVLIWGIIAKMIELLG